MTSPDSSHIQATAARPHGCKNRAKYVSQRVPTLFPGEFRKLNNETLTLGMIIDDLSRRLFIATLVFHLCARDRAVKSAEMAFFASIYLLQCCLQNRRWENQEYHPKFHLPLLRSAKSSRNNVGKLEKMFKRAWLIAAVPPNWIISCGLFSEILEVLELNFHFITMMNFSYLVLVAALVVKNV